MRLKGSRIERAKAHGEFLASLSADQRDTLAYHPLSRKNQTLIARALVHSPIFAKQVSKAYEWFVKRLFKKLPPLFRDQIEAFSQSAGISLHALTLALFQPDMLMALAKMSSKEKRNFFREGAPGCSSLVVRAEGKLHFLRNLDYPAAGYWEKHPAIIYHEPSEPDQQNYVQITSLGVDLAGLHGINDAGIAFTLHAHFGSRIQFSGTPIFFLGEEILAKAKNLNDALVMIERFQSIGSWALNITSFRENTSVCVELLAGKHFVRTLDGDVLSSANHYASPEFEKNALHFSGAATSDSVARKSALQNAGIPLQKNFSWAKAFQALADHRDAETNTPRVCGNITSVVTTIQSVAFDQDHLYLSVREETPTGLGPYLQFPLQFPEPGFKPLSISPELHYPEEFIKALHHYHLAYVAYQVDQSPLSVALDHLEKASQAWPEDPHLLMQKGYFQIKSHENYFASESFRLAQKNKLTPHIRAVAQYFEGVCHDLLGKRTLALDLYQMVLETPELEPKLRQRALRRVRKPFQRIDVDFLAPDLQFVEPIDYR